MFGKYISAILLLAILALATCCSQPSKQGAANDATSAKTSIAFLEKEHDLENIEKRKRKDTLSSTRMQASLHLSYTRLRAIVVAHKSNSIHSL